MPMLGQDTLLFDAFDGDIGQGGLSARNGDGFGVVAVVLGSDALAKCLHKFGGDQARDVVTRRKPATPVRKRPMRHCIVRIGWSGPSDSQCRYFRKIGCRE